MREAIFICRKLLIRAISSMFSPQIESYFGEVPQEETVVMNLPIKRLVFNLNSLVHYD